MTDLNEQRLKILTYTSGITLFLNLLSMSSQGRIEQHMDSQGSDLRENATILKLDRGFLIFS
jgi:hypothetical protein